MSHRLDRPDPSASRRAGRGGGQGVASRREASLARRFATHLRLSGLLPADAHVLVALSGGLDSVTLLHLLRFGPAARPVRAAHFDHGMRPGSGADARWVAGLCRAWDVPLVSGEAPGPLRSEAEARLARYRFLEESAQAGELIATGHQLDDQAETVLFRAARGAGLHGLAGIPPRRGRIVRPLLPFERAEILEYARAAGLRWRDDPTNVTGAFVRNRLRAEVLPELERLVPGARRALAHLGDHARRSEEGWRALLDRLLPDLSTERPDGSVEVARARLLSYPSEIQGRILRHLLRRHGFPPGRAGTGAAVEFITTGASGSRIRTGGGIELEREFDRIVVRRRLPVPPDDRPVMIEGAAAGEDRAVLGGRGCTVRWELVALAPEPAPRAEAFDPAAVRFPLQLRAWRAGDRIRLPGGSKKLKKLFAERRVPRVARPGQPVLADAGGRVLWVVDVARAPIARPLPGRPALLVTVSDGGR